MSDVDLNGSGGLKSSVSDDQHEANDRPYVSSASLKKDKLTPHKVRYGGHAVEIRIVNVNPTDPDYFLLNYQSRSFELSFKHKTAFYVIIYFLLTLFAQLL